jgi:hypothetical protein
MDRPNGTLMQSIWAKFQNVIDSILPSRIQQKDKRSETQLELRFAFFSVLQRDGSKTGHAMPRLKANSMAPEVEAFAKI